jgi:glycosyltransferase involved in cell wall biosynthesis
MTQNPILLSAIIITRNEKKNIAACLDSIQFADEIIVVDYDSTDSTPDICREKNAQVVITTDWPGFGPQKNRALGLAKGKWILSIDADERVTPELATEIQQVIQQLNNQHTAYTLPRLSNYCGRWIKHSGWYPDPVLRLFQREHAQFSDDLVHERVILQTSEAISSLSNHLLHYPFQNLETVLAKINHYSSAGAQMRHEKGQKSSLRKAIFHGLWAFVRTYFIKRGFLDGREGFILAVSSAEAAYYRYLKLLYLKP